MTCGRGSLTREHPEKPGTWQYLSTSCKKLTCPDCGPLKAAEYKKAIFAAAKEHGLQRHLTLTLDPGLIPPDRDSIDYINQVWHRFLAVIFRERNVKLTYLRVLELQENGTAHFHVLVKEQFAQDVWIQFWVGVGGGHQCRIRFRDGNRGAAYVTKYVSKELLLEIPPGRRRVATCRLIRLFEPHEKTGWEWLSTPMWMHHMNCFGTNFQQAINSLLDRYFESESPPINLADFPEDRKNAA